MEKRRYEVHGTSNNGASSQDDDGDMEVSYYIGTTNRPQAILLFEEIVKDLQRLGQRGEPKNISFNVRLEENGTVIRQANQVYEAVIRESVLTLKRGRGWIRPNQRISRQREETHKDGTRVFYSTRSSSDY
jgi:hypothetical protein